MSAPLPPVTGSDWQAWARQIRAFLQRNLSSLQRKDSDSRAAEDGILLWDAINQYPVVSIDGEFIQVITEGALSFDVAQAEREIFNVYGDTVSVKDKAKNLNKFGSNSTVGTSFETLAEFQGTTANETFVSTNLIDSVVSSSGSDTQTVKIEGHTINGSGNLTFVSQNATLTGQTEVTLSTPLARANRIFIADSGTFNSPQSSPAGVVSVYDNTDGITAGVPDTAAATKVLLQIGENQSQKCQTSISSTDYWILTDFSADIGNAGGPADRVQVRIEIRDVANGGVWRPLGRNIDLVVGDSPSPAQFIPHRIVPKDHDVRVRARSNASTASVEAGLSGYLAVITS